MRYWLLKSEPSVFGIDDLAQRPDQIEPWDGVRNYQARNFMRDDMQVADKAFFYHSNCEVPGIVGIVSIVRAGYPDDTAWNPEHKYYDPASTLEKPRWYRVDVKLERKLTRTIALGELKSHASQLEGLALLQRGSRLSVLPVTEAHWHYILGLE